VIASLLPRQQAERVNPFDEFTDEELRQLEEWLEAKRAGEFDEWLEAHRAGKGGEARQDPPDTFFVPRAESA
jgi:hypothetical protein